MNRSLAIMIHAVCLLFLASYSPIQMAEPMTTNVSPSGVTEDAENRLAQGMVVRNWHVVV